MIIYQLDQSEATLEAEKARRVSATRQNQSEATMEVTTATAGTLQR